MKNKVFITAAFLLFTTLSVSAQSEAQSESLKTFGIGVEVNKFSWTEVYTDFVSPTANLAFTVTPHKNLRIEPVFGFVAKKSKTDMSDAEVKSTAVSFGLGFYGLKNKTKVVISYGLKIDYTMLKDKYQDDPYGDDFTLDGSAVKIGPSFGGEYMFSPNFSMGASFGVKYFIIDSESLFVDSFFGDSFTVSESTTGVLIDSGLQVRVYF